MNVIYIPILALVFLIGYFIGCYKPRKSDGILYVNPDNEEKCTWLGMKIYDASNIYSKNQVHLDVKQSEEFRKDYKSYSEEDKRND